MTDTGTNFDPLVVARRVAEAQHVLATLGMPPAQQNAISALTLLALFDLRPDSPWSDATNPLRGVSPIIDFANTWYRMREGGYAENTRETFRKNAIHYFVAARLIVANPDDPNRPTNSPRTVYQITPEALAVLRSFGADTWAKQIASYLDTVGRLADRYAGRRTIEQLPLRRLTDQTFTLSPGPHSDLILQIVTEFAARFTPGATLIYTGDTGRKLKSYFDEEALARRDDRICWNKDPRCRDSSRE